MNTFIVPTWVKRESLVLVLSTYGLMPRDRSKQFVNQLDDASVDELVVRLGEALTPDESDYDG